jgi:hypothetical protein
MAMRRPSMRKPVTPIIKKLKRMTACSGLLLVRMR